MIEQRPFEILRNISTVIRELGKASEALVNAVDKMKELESLLRKIKAAGESMVLALPAELEYAVAKQMLASIADALYRATEIIENLPIRLTFSRKEVLAKARQVAKDIERIRADLAMAFHEKNPDIIPKLIKELREIVPPILRSLTDIIAVALLELTERTEKEVAT